MMNNIIRIVVVSIVLVSIRSASRKSLNNHCLNRSSFASIGGGRRRNVFSFQDIQWCLWAHVCFSFSTVVLFWLVEMRIIMSPITIMKLWGASIVALLSFKDIFMPWRVFINSEDYHSVWEEASLKKYTQFYVRNPKLIPRGTNIPPPKKKHVIKVASC